MLDNEQPKDLASAAEAYMREAFGIHLGLAPIEPSHLPHFILDKYRLWQGTLNGEAILLAAIRTPGRGAISDFSKHREALRRQLGIRVMLLLIPHVAANMRRQLLDRRIGFLVPGAQVYIPEALLDFRERTSVRRPEISEQFGPVTQLVILGALLGEPLSGMNQTLLAKQLHVSAMSISRTFDELEALGIAKPRQVGRQRQLHMLIGGKELWREVEPRLQTPVRKVRTVRGRLPDRTAPFAGESALAHYTMLAEPRFPVRAIAAADWKRLQTTLELTTGFAFDDDDRVELETWGYDPRLFAKDEVVDRLSLYLSLRHHSDERVGQAAEQLLEPFAW